MAIVPEGPPDDQATDTVLAFYRVIRRLAQARPPGQHPTSWPLLGRLAATGSARVSDLAEFAGLDASTVSRHVQSLEQDGYLVRRVDPDDRRAAFLEITDSGQSFMAAAIEARASVLREATRAWPDSDRSELARLLVKLAEPKP